MVATVVAGSASGARNAKISWTRPPAGRLPRPCRPRRPARNRSCRPGPNSRRSRRRWRDTAPSRPRRRSSRVMAALLAAAPAGTRRGVQLPLESCLLLALAVEPRVLDRDRRFRRQCLEAVLDRPGTERSLFPAVQIEYADGTHVVGVVRVLDIPDQLQWDAIDGPDAELDGAFVGLGEHLVVQVGDELWFGGGEHLFGDLSAGFEGVAGQRGLLGPAPERELQCAGGVDEHDEAAFSPAQGDRVVDHHY